jgi:hypothetical protein
MTALVRDERGSVTVEAAIWLASAMLALLGLVQIAFWWAAMDTCAAAAQAGLDTGRVLDGTDTDAQRGATSYLDRVNALVRDPHVSATSTTTQMRVTVAAEVLMVVPIPGMRWHIAQDAVGPREHVTDPGDS